MESEVKIIPAWEGSNNFRYERKFTVPRESPIPGIIEVIKSNKGMFQEVYHLRQINNIYLDTLNYRDYSDNVLGVSDRKKVRIRWYGDTFGEITKPVLEVKLKNGMVGDKWSFPLESFKLDDAFDGKDLIYVFNNSNLPASILESLNSMTPAMLNSYQREYFLSADKKFRVTVDYDILYRRIKSNWNNFNILPVKDENTIIELKYGLKDDVLANSISTQFPFRLNKNSKYVNGVNAFTDFPQ